MSNQHFLQAIRAWANDDIPTAARLASRAFEREPEHLVYAEAALYLDRVLQEGRQNVYVSPKGFRAFIRSGGNVSIYRETSAALKQVYEQHGPISLLDIGVGDGLALLPALTDNIRQIDLIEPSTALLDQTSAALAKRGVPHRGHNGTLQQFVAQHGDAYWDLAEATFSLQSIPPDERSVLLHWLRTHVDRLIMVEFDVPTFASGADPTDFLSLQRIDYVTTRYLRGLTEYHNQTKDDSVVAQGFLMPVFFGYFDRSANRTNWEIPIPDWVKLLHAAGFTQIEARPIFDYWWAPACMIDAS